MISAMYDYGTGTLLVYKDQDLDFELTCSVEVARSYVLEKYGFDPQFAQLNSE